MTEPIAMPAPADEAVRARARDEVDHLPAITPSDIFMAVAGQPNLLVPRLDANATIEQVMSVFAAHPNDAIGRAALLFTQLVAGQAWADFTRGPSRGEAAFYGGSRIFRGVDPRRDFGGWDHEARIPNDVRPVGSMDAPTMVTPEPATLVLLGTGMVGVLGMRRRRSKRTTE